MKLPNWFKVLWWVLLLGTLSALLHRRYADIVAGNSTIFDALAFLVWVALMLAPVFQEVHLFGFKLKQEIESLKSDVKEQISSLRANISTNIRADVSPQFHIVPPPDLQLPEIEKNIQSLVKTEFEKLGKSQPAWAFPRNRGPGSA